MVDGRSAHTVGPVVRAVAVLAIALGSCKSARDKPDPGAGSSDDATGARSFDAAPPEPKSPMYVDPSTLDFGDNPELLERVTASPYGYFRFTNILFSQVVCRRFEGKLRGMPTVNLHGDAHVENYAVTKTGRGLTDFDDSSAGPAIIDLVRFGAALQIASKERGWESEAGALIDKFFSGYRDALADPDVDAPVPDVVERLRKQFTGGRRPFLEFAESLMEPVSVSERADFEPGYRRYTKLMLSEHPELPAQFFDIQKLGRISVGFGSALDTKYLIRIRGKTDAPEDDMVLEAKEVRDLSGIDCINSRQGGGAFRILVAQARIAEVPHKFLAHVPRGPDTSSRPFWVHAWEDHYIELRIAEQLTKRDLAQVAYDVGVQLGRGHVRQIASPLDSQLRKAQLDTLDAFDDSIRDAISALSTETLEAWKQFRTDAEQMKRDP